MNKKCLSTAVNVVLLLWNLHFRYTRSSFGAACCERCLSIPWLVAGIVGRTLSVSMPPCTYALLLGTIPAMVLYDLCTCTCYLGKDASDLCGP